MKMYSGSTVYLTKRRRDDIDEKIEALSKVINKMTGRKKYFLQAKLCNLQLKQQKLLTLSRCHPLNESSKQNLMREFDIAIAENDIEIEIESIRSSKKFKRTKRLILDSARDKLSCRPVMSHKSTNTEPVHIVRKAKAILPLDRGISSTLEISQKRSVEENVSPINSIDPEDASSTLEMLSSPKSMLQKNENIDSIQSNWFENTFEIDNLASIPPEVPFQKSDIENCNSVPNNTETVYNYKTQDKKNNKSVDKIYSFAPEVKKSCKENTETIVKELPEAVGATNTFSETNHSHRSEDLSVKLANSKEKSAKSQKKSGKYQDKFAKSQDKLAKSQDKSTKFQEKSPKSQNNSAKSQDQSVKCQVPLANFQLQCAEYQKECAKYLSVKSQGLSDKSQNLAEKCKELSAKSQDQSIKCQVPLANFQLQCAEYQKKYAKYLSAKSQGLSDKSQNLAEKCKELSVKSQTLLTLCKELYVDPQDQLIKNMCTESQSEHTLRDSPTKSQNITTSLFTGSKNTSAMLNKHSTSSKNKNKALKEDNSSKQKKADQNSSLYKISKDKKKCLKERKEKNDKQSISKEDKEKENLVNDLFKDLMASKIIQAETNISSEKTVSCHKCCLVEEGQMCAHTIMEILEQC